MVPKLQSHERHRPAHQKTVATRHRSFFCFFLPPFQDRATARVVVLLDLDLDLDTPSCQFAQCLQTCGANLTNREVFSSCRLLAEVFPSLNHCHSFPSPKIRKPPATNRWAVGVGLYIILSADEPTHGYTTDHVHISLQGFPSLDSLWINDITFDLCEPRSSPSKKPANPKANAQTTPDSGRTVI